MNAETRLILRNQFNIMRYLYGTESCKVPMFIESLYKQIQKTIETLNPPTNNLEEQRAKEIKVKAPGVFIERAAPITKEGIKAVCGTDEEYSEYVKKHTHSEVKG